MTIKKQRTANSAYPKVAAQCKFEHLFFKQALVRIDSLVFQTATFGQPPPIVSLFKTAHTP